MKTVLIGEISSYKGIICVRFLKKYYGNNVRILTFDSRQFTRLIRTRFSDLHFLVSNPDININKYNSDLKEIVEKQKVDFFIPINSKYISELLANKDNFRGSLDYYGPHSSYEILNNKKKLQDYLEEISHFVMPAHYDKFENAKLPFVFKPEASSSSMGVMYFLSPRDLTKYESVVDNKGVFQQYIKGKGVGFSCFCRNGEILVSYSHIRLLEYPLTGGSSLYRKTFINDRLLPMVEPIVRGLKWNGFAMFEFKLTANNEIYLIEVNPRIWGSINQGLENGINYFEPMLGKFSQAISNSNIKANRTFLAPLIYFAFFKLAVKGKFSILFNFLVNLRNNKADISFLCDFKGYLSIIFRKIL